MKSSLTRRTFIKHSTLAAAGTWLAGCQTQAARKFSANDKINCVQIGCGGRGLSAHVDWIISNSKDNLVAIVDPDEKRHAEVKRYLKGKEIDPDKLQVFTDYRKMFDKIGKSIDAVFIATPNHQHALPATIAMH